MRNWFENNRKLSNIFLFGLFLLVVSQAKVFSRTLYADEITINEGWIHIGRTTFQPHSTFINLQLKLRSKQFKTQSPIDIEILAIPNEFLDQQLSHKCDYTNYDEQMLKKRSQQQITFRASFSKQLLVFNATKNIEVREPITYSFILKDCMKNLINPQIIVSSKLKLRLEVTSDGRNYVANEFHRIWTLPLLIILSYLVLNILNRDPKDESWTKLIIKISIWSGIVSLVLKYIDHLLYAYFSGEHYKFLDAFYLVGQSVSDALLMFLAIFVAFGWSITFDYHMDFDLWLPSSFFVGFSYIATTVLNKSRDNWYNKFHVYDTFAGYIMVGFRAVFFLLFAYGINRSYKQLTQKDLKLKKFFKEFAVFGTAYLVSFPLCLIIAEAFSQYNRYQCMTIVLEIARILFNICFSMMITWKDSSYRQAITKEQVDKNKKTN